MQILTSILELAHRDKPFFLAAGVFDGVHAGHREVLRTATEFCSSKLGELGVLTFEPHPAKVLRPDACPPRISSRREKHALLASLGAAFLLEIPFTKEFSQLLPEDFLGDLCSAGGVNFLGICAGTSWSFGKDRRGSAEFLHLFGGKHGFTFLGVPPVLFEGIPVSSSRIREMIGKGEVGEAAKCLLRPYILSGIVQTGAQLGRTIGFPTANLTWEQELLPADGVYAVRVEFEDTAVAGVANLGLRPTINPQSPHRVFEVHLLDFHGDLYGRHLRVSLHTRLRGERTFPSLAGLQKQIGEDILRAREWFATEHSELPSARLQKNPAPVTASNGLSNGTM